MKKTIQQYVKQDLRADLISGLVVGLIALPLAIAFAVASGARPEQGIYTSIIAGIVVGLLSGSRFQVSGPTGAFIVILLGVVNKFGIDGLMMAGFMSGCILLLMGIFKFGSVIKYIPYPVTVGFTAGIGVIIFSGQIKDVLGLSFPHRPADFIETVKYIVEAIGRGVNLSAIIIGAVTFFAYVLWKKYSKNIPPAPIALAAGIVVSVLIRSFGNGVLPQPALVGEIPAGLPVFHMLDFSFDKMRLLLPSALTIAMLGSIESLLSAVVADSMTGTKHNSNKELMAQGIGNMILPFFSAIPATGAIARTAANIRNGARTRVSSIIHGFVLLLILLVAAPYAKNIPMAALGMILMMVAYSMAEIPHFVRLLKAPPRDALVLVATFLLTVFVDLTMAVGVGIVLAAMLFIHRVSALTISEGVDDDAGGSEGSERLHASLINYPQIVLYELSGPLFFGVAAELENRIQHGPRQMLIIRMKHVNGIDASAINALEVIIKRALKNNGKVFLATMHESIKHKLAKLGIIEKIGGDYYAPSSTTEAIERAKKEVDKKA